MGKKLPPIPQGFRMLSIDPGETTGWASFANCDLDDWGQLNTPDPTTATPILKKLITVQNPDIVIMEDYRVYAWRSKQHIGSTLITPRLIGMLETLCQLDEIRVYKQAAHRAKTLVDDDKLKAWHVYKAGQRHARDAIRHGIFYMFTGTFEKLQPQPKET